MVASFFIWLKVYKNTLHGRWLFLLALFSFASSYKLTYYAAELKQYSMDVLVTAIFALFIGYQGEIKNREPGRGFAIFTLLLPFTMLLSYASFFVVEIVLYNFLRILRENKTIFPLFLGYAFMCLLFGIIVYNFDLKYSLGQRGIFHYWNDYFLSSGSFYCFIKSFGEGIQRLGTWWFVTSPILKKISSFLIPFFICSLFGFGFVSLKRNRFKICDIDGLSIVIFMELFVAGIFKVYPFTGERVTLFFAPFVFYLLVKGMDYFKKPNFVNAAFKGIYAAFLVICSVDSLSIFLKLYR
jgi:hypothetical protein